LERRRDGKGREDRERGKAGKRGEGKRVEGTSVYISKCIV